MSQPPGPAKPEGLEAQMAAILARRQAHNQLRRLTTIPPDSIDFSSNAYLSLSTHPAVQQEFLARLQRLATEEAGEAREAASPPSLLGAGGSRLLDGNTVAAEALERKIAEFHGAPAGLLFNSALDANVGLLACAPQPGDVIVYDELAHASMHDGMRLGRARACLAFAHNVIQHDNDDDHNDDSLQETVSGGVETDKTAVEMRPAMTPSGRSTRPEANHQKRSLRSVLRQLAQRKSEDGRHVRDGQCNVFICVEGVYSMDGDVVPLQDVVECVERCLPRGNGYIVVDEAHSTGLFGRDGRGLVCELGLERRVWARVHGFGKAMSCAGGIVLCSPTTRSYLINYARTFIYTTAMALPSLVSIDIVYDFIMSGQAEPLRHHLRHLLDYTHAALVSLCSRLMPPPGILFVRKGRPQSPIIPLLTSRPRSLAQSCQSSGVMVRPIVAPTVPLGSERVRVCLHARNTVEEVDKLCSTVETWLRAQMEEPVHEPAAQPCDVLRHELERKVKL